MERREEAIDTIHSFRGTLCIVISLNTKHMSRAIILPGEDLNLSKAPCLFSRDLESRVPVFTS